MLKKAIVSFCFFSILILPTFALAIPDKDTGNLGEIRQSILTVEEFKELYGDGWVLMAGQELSPSDDLRSNYPRWARLPDARGVFLRSNNQHRNDGKGNTQFRLACGDYQGDQVGPHKHTGRTHGGNPRGYRLVFGGSNKGEGRAHNHETGWSGANGGVRDYHDSEYAGANHTHNLDIDLSEGSETRPRCVIVNTFIKINKTKENRQTNEILEAIQNIPALMKDTGSLLQVLQAYIQVSIDEKLQNLNRKQ